MRRLFASGCVLAALSAVFVIPSCKDQESPGFPVLPDEDAGAEGGAEVDGAISGDLNKGLLLEGTVIGEQGPFEGQVLVALDGTIACAQPGDACAKDPKAEGVARLNVNGVIAPGLIDTHNHILFDIFDGSDWLPSQVYQDHDQWPNEARYKEMVDVKQCLEDASQGKPTWCPAKFDGAGNVRCEMLKFGELKGLVAGTTSIVGLAGTSFPCFDSLVRSVDTQFNGLGSDKIQTAAILPAKTTADGVCRNYADGKTTSYLIHVGEGTNAKALAEWANLGTLTTTPGCLYAPQTAITHGTAFGAAEFATMKEKGMKLVWSPASNIALYGATTNIPLALDNGIVVALAPDWSMGGSPNLLDELRAAKKWSDEKWGGRLTTQMLVEMETKNAATVLGLGDRIGTIKPGYQADLFVVRGDKTKPYDAIVAATPKDVRLTLVGGKAIYGDEGLRALAAFGPACEALDACGAQKFVCASVPGSQTEKLTQTVEQIKGFIDCAICEIYTARNGAGLTGAKFAPLPPLVSCGAK
jgi:5-methylthioadenosine/S-adenosylhomocysteine deaminase